MLVGDPRRRAERAAVRRLHRPRAGDARCSRARCGTPSHSTDARRARVAPRPGSAHGDAGARGCSRRRARRRAAALLAGPAGDRRPARPRPRRGARARRWSAAAVRCDAADRLRRRLHVDARHEPDRLGRRRESTTRRDEGSGDAGTRLGLDRVACYAGSADRRGRRARPRSTGSRAARELGFEGLLAEHRRAWAARWDDADVAIDGDAELQLAVRFALFHLMASVADEGEAAVGARGLTGGAYRGHVFWDSDVFVLPFLAATHPAGGARDARVPRAAAARGAAGRSRAGPCGRALPVGVGGNRRGRDAASMLGPRAASASRSAPGELEEHIVADVAWAAAQLHRLDRRRGIRCRARARAARRRPRATGPRGSSSTPTGAPTSAT